MSHCPSSWEEKLYCYRTGRIVVVIVAERLDQRVAVNVFNVPQSVIVIHSLIHPRMYFFMLIVIKIQGGT